MGKDAILARANSLVAEGPGRVRVKRIADLSDVQLLRRCRELLTSDERADVSTTLKQVEEAMRGIEVANAPVRKRKSKWRLLGGIATAMGSKEERQADEWQTRVAAAGGPAKLPPPPGLMAAAEASLVAELAGPRADANLEALRLPWDQARVEPL